MDSVEPMQVDPQDPCFSAKSALEGLDSEYPDTKIPGNVERIGTGTGVRIRAEMNRKGLGFDVEEKKAGQAVPSRLSFDGFLKAADTNVEAEEDYLKGRGAVDEACVGGGSRKGSGSDGGVVVGSVGLADDADVVVKRETMDVMQIMLQAKEEVEMESCIGCSNGDKRRKEIDEGLDMDVKVVVKKEDEDSVHPLPQVKKEVKMEVESSISFLNGDKRWEDTGRGDGVIDAMPIDWAKPVVKQEREELKPRYINQKARIPKKMGVEESNRKVASREGVEDEDFAVEPDWYLVGRSVVTGISTAKGNKLVDNEIVHFSFPSENMSYRFNANWIVRFSTKRYGEIGRLPMDWGKCVVPLVSSSKVKVLGRCVVAPGSLHIMQEILLYVSFYIHHTVFTQMDKSLRIDSSFGLSTTLHPLLSLFSLLDNSPLKEAMFVPAEINSWKGSLNADGNGELPLSTVPLALAQSKKNCQKYAEGSKDDQAISESSLNSIVGAKDAYDLEEMEPPSTLMCDLRPYQKQALYWMSEAEKQNDSQKAAETLHPCWSEYRICDERASSIYVNIFSGEATTQFQGASQMARGGILADAMGLGKTVMTIALILARLGKGTPNDSYEDDAKRRKIESNGRRRAKGGTLIVCPMALLGQWKDELETHSRPDSISVIVHYGGERTSDPRAISEHDVVLTTYGVLASAFKNDGEESIYQRVEWHRVVLDEAHTIKSWKSQNARAAFTLTAYCRWCLTGTPIQNNLQDLYSLFCFLQVEPWCNWGWWSKYIQQPYDSGDSKGLMRVKAILRPLMLRRTKETKDKDGRPILVLPPTDIRIIECEQSEAEHDFYDALFRRSKVQFDQFVAQGKVLHNYASILELLLRLRQCCNHPYLVMSRGDSNKYADLNKLAKKFLETKPDLTASNQIVLSKAYVEEVVEGLQRGDNKECPICLESADDPVLTPCAHRMCRECLLSSWRTPCFGPCPICRNMVQKTDLITCPSESRFRVDIEKDWKESSKVSKLLECLERVRKSGSRQKSIVFSQWTSFLDLLEIPLGRRRIGYLRFDGKLSQKQRERVLREFSETDEKMVLLMSLKAGGVGLNLTAASNVFLMDPWWNPAVEEQAIMRIHRIGQKQTVRVRRFIVKGTVEERLQQVQSRKQRMIAGALTDEEVRSARIEELKMLFR